jgi:hypothetical protein
MSITMPRSPQCAADQLRRCDLFVGGEHLRDQHRPKRRGGVEDRGEARTDPGLADKNQGEGNGVVDQPEHQQFAPVADEGLIETGHAAESQMQRDGREADAKQHQRHRWHMLHGDAAKEERAAPDQAQQEQQTPGGQGHGTIGGLGHLTSLLRALLLATASGPAPPEISPVMEAASIAGCPAG